MRYTKTVAQEDLIDINNALKAANHPYFLCMSGRNGYQGLDLFSNESTCIRTIATGTPRECITAAHQYGVGVFHDYFATDYFATVNKGK